MDFTLNSQCGSDLARLIHEILSMTLGIKFIVVGYEISDGKNRLHCSTQEESEHIIFCNAWHSKNELKDNIFTGVIEPYLKNQFIKS